MVLEIAAAIIGIIAAAGKVLEVVSPMVSSFQNVDSLVATVHTETNQIRIILPGLKAMLDDLESMTSRRKAMIKVDQLLTTLTDGVLLFDELEFLVRNLSAHHSNVIHRAKWLRKEKALSSLILRLQSFKSSIGVMLHIVQWYADVAKLVRANLTDNSESDSEARVNAQTLLTLTSSLLQSNRELSSRLAHLEDQLGTTMSLCTHRPGSLAPSDDTITRATILSRTEHLNLLTNDTETIRSFEFEKDLEALWVYQKMTRNTTDASFCTSLVRSHAWTALTEVSLSDISVISVVALPISLFELENPYHYEFRGQMTFSQLSTKPPPISDILGHQFSHQNEQEQVVATFRSFRCGSETAALSLHSMAFSQTPAFPNPRSLANLNVLLVGMVNGTVAQAIVTTFDGKTILLDDTVVKMHIRSTDYLTKHTHESASRLQRCIEEGIVLLVYSTSARRTFTELQSYFHRHLQHHASRALIIGLHSETSVRAVPTEEGRLVASRLNCRFDEASVSQPIWDSKAFQVLGREYMLDMRHGGVQEATDAWDPSYGSLVE
tara:strand:+ start:269 stop:1918 length:1650 start_codon:yes stop_codon:yes gene_type:complete